METSFQSFFEWEAFTDCTETKSKNIEFTLLHDNVRSLQKHWDQLSVYLSSRLSNLDVLALNEVNVNKATCTGFKFSNFTCHSLCREKKKRWLCTDVC